MTLVFLAFFSCNDFTEQNLSFNDLKNLETRQTKGNIDLLLSRPQEINKGNFSLEKVAANIAINVKRPSVKKLLDSIKELSTTIDGHCNSVRVFESLKEEQLKQMRQPIQISWKKAILNYHRVAAMNFGPGLKENSTVIESLYSFLESEKDFTPGKCSLDLIKTRYSITEERGRNAANVLPSLSSVENYHLRGLDSIEALFFGPLNKSKCKIPNQRVIDYFKKPLIKRESHTCIISKHLMKDILRKTQELEKSWDSNYGNYTEKMLRGQYGPIVEVINNISQALFYLDTNIKDKKLAYPAGLDVRINGENKKCINTNCYDYREHPYSEIGFDAIEVSLIAFRDLFQGRSIINQKKGFGLDNLLIENGLPGVATRMLYGIETTLKNIRKLKNSTNLKDALEKISSEKCEQSRSENRLEEICSIIWDIRKTSDALKNEYINALSGISAPRQAQGDND